MAKKPTTTPEVPATPRGPLTHTLGLIGSTKAGYVPIHVVTQDTTVLGFIPLTQTPIEWGYAVDKLKIMSTRFYLNRGAFKDMDLKELMPVKGVVHTLGVARIPDGRYVPVSLKIEDDKVVKQATLFSSPLALLEACSVYKVRFAAFFISRKLFIE